MTNTNLMEILTKAIGKTVALFKYDPNSSDPMRMYKGECVEFDSFGFATSQDKITLLDTSGKESEEYEINLVSLMFSNFKPKRGKSGCNQAEFEIGNDAYVLTFS